MSHLDDDALASIAIGDGTPDELEHVATCPECAAELASFTAMTARLGALDSEVLAQPPAELWQAISSDLTPHPDSEPAQERAVPVAPADDLATRRNARRARTGARWWTLGAAAAAGAVIGGVGVAALGSGDDQVRSVLASSALTDLATEQPAGEATVEVLDDGQRVLVVDTSDVVQRDDAYLEVWLIDEQIEGMVSLGHLTGDHTVFTLPDGVDIAQFPIVDISIEPVDGVPTHSGDSITRGVLGT
ncbi:anti-sigma factor [Demequina sp. NBRC 110057]|uniref:anti-sigma factor n=1 Tax=Demequina sp. NBRC 110057 TaxID=1570346 RepID=UPI000A04101E|nr:anti-sigma factor [Demequina sp. NBRC 110057]